ncbi:MAG: hypothetical protein HRU38_00175 [Saccharospirillaceae bacterium]|nr:hypothetical protein [Pseudomonadales bacterium]NRB77077.1 hypothetical protein [Saccharospirillaceae bacterium]
MKLILKVILWLIFIGGMAFVGQHMMNTPTHVQIVFGDKLVEMSLWLLVLAGLVLNMVIYLAVKASSFIRPVEAYYSWREKTKTKKSYRFLAEAMFQWFSGNVKTAEKQALLAKAQQPILSQLMLAYLKHNYLDAIKEVEKVDDRFVPFLHWMQLQNLNSHADYVSALPILREDALIYKKNAQYLKTAVNVFINTNQYEHLVGLYSNINKLLPEESEQLNNEIALKYLEQCLGETNAAQLLLKRYKNLNVKMQKNAIVLEQYSILAAKLLPENQAFKIMQQTSASILTSDMVVAFNDIKIEAHEKLKQIEVWIQSHQSLGVLHLMAYNNCVELELTTKAQVYIISFYELEKNPAAKIRLMAYYHEKNQPENALNLL